MKKEKRLLCMLLSLLMLMMTFTACGSKKASSSGPDLNSMKLDDIIEKAKAEKEVQSVGMPDNWANWGETWKELTEKYGVTHADVDMSSAEELALFESEKNAPTKDIGDVGSSFGPLAVTKGLTIPYKTSYWNDIPDWAKDKDGNWIIGYYGTICFMTNKDKVANPPKSWADILSGNYKVCLGDVARGTQSQMGVLAAAIANGGSESNIQPGIDYFKKLAEQGRIDIGENSLARVEKGEVDVAIYWDFNALGYRDQFLKNNPKANFEIHVPVDGSAMGGYCTVINKYAPHPHAAALAREFILSDEGQINLAKGYARPIRSSVKLPEDVKATLIPDAEYVKVQPIKDFAAWEKTVKELGPMWQDEVLANLKK